MGERMTFKEKDYKGKLEFIEKYYDNDTLFFAAYFNNYNSFHIYIRIDYIEKLKAYKLRWFDLDFVKTSKIFVYESSEYIEEDVVLEIERLCEKLTIDQKKNYWGKENNVGIYIDSKCQNSDDVKIKFYKYIPEKHDELYEIMKIVFDILPKKLNPFFEEISYIYSDVSRNFKYENSFRFDLFNGDLDKLFDIPVVVRGTRYYDERRVLFLEKVDDRYFAVVNGNELYVVIIKYDEVSKDMQVYCSCPCDFFCKHIYAVIMAIREKNFKKFYKIMPRRNYADMFDKLMNISYVFSIGMVEDVIGILSDDGEIKWVDILDEDKNSKWVIVEDDEDNKFTKTMTKFLDEK